MPPSPTQPQPAWSPAPPPPWWQVPSPWQPTGWGAPQQRTNGLAIAALVTGIVALVPVSIGLAIGAVSQIRRRRDAGLGLAVGGIAASATWVLLAAVVAVLGLNGVFNLYSRHGDLGDVASRDVGTCLDEHPSTVTDCSTPHKLEVYYATTIADPSWPGEKDVDDEADEICYQAFERYVGRAYEDSEYDYTFFGPSEQEWAVGERTIVCVVQPAGRYLVGSVKGSDR